MNTINHSYRNRWTLFTTINHGNSRDPPEIRKQSRCQVAVAISSRSQGCHSSHHTSTDLRLENSRGEQGFFKESHRKPLKAFFGHQLYVLYIYILIYLIYICIFFLLYIMLAPDQQHGTLLWQTFSSLFSNLLFGGGGLYCGKCFSRFFQKIVPN